MKSTLAGPQKAKGLMASLQDREFDVFPTALVNRCRQATIITRRTDNVIPQMNIEKLHSDILRHKATPIHVNTRNMSLVRITMVSALWILFAAVPTSGFALLSSRCSVSEVHWIGSLENRGRLDRASFALPVLRASTVPAESDELPVILEESVPRSTLSPKGMERSYYNVEKWCVAQIQNKYEEALSVKCPFFRRRATDFVEGLDIILRAFVVQHRGLLGSPPGWKCQSDARPKALNLPLEALMETIRQDWRVDTNKGYYITGRLNTTIYRDYCLFDGPDPDMPVRGLHKYLSASSKLFDQGKSRSELLSLDIRDGAIVARWRMNGILRLPWKPRLPEIVGTTTYHTDSNGLVYRHEEEWETPVLQAFASTFFPELSEMLWPKDPSS